MLINGIDVSTYKATLLSKEIPTSDVTVYDDWLTKSLSPIYIGRKVTYKTVKCQFIIEDTTDEACLTDISNFAAQIIKCVIKFDDLPFYYDCVVASKETTRLQKGYFAFIIELKSGYSYLPEVTTTLSGTSQTLNVAGNLATPAIVTLTPAINLASAVLTGFGKSITVTKLIANTPILIDGESCLLTENGANKFADITIWEFPSLQPGSNPVAINQNGVTVQVKYKPKFM